MEKYTIKFATHIANCWPALILSALLILGFVLNSLGFFEANIVELFILFSLIVIAPTLLVHFNYYVVNKNDEFYYDRLNHEYKIHINHESFVFTNNDIVEVEYVISKASQRKDIQFMPWDSYNHAIVKLKNGKEFTITSLLIGKQVTLPVNKEVEKIKANLFRVAPKHKLK